MSNICLALLVDAARRPLRADAGGELRRGYSGGVRETSDRANHAADPTEVVDDAGSAGASQVGSSLSCVATSWVSLMMCTD